MPSISPFVDAVDVVKPLLLPALVLAALLLPLGMGIGGVFRLLAFVCRGLLLSLCPFDSVEEGDDDEELFTLTLVLVLLVIVPS